MNAFVWVSHAPSDSTLADGHLKSDLSFSGAERLIEIEEVARVGGTIASSDFPSEIWGEMGEYRAHHFPDRWPHLSYYAGFWIISDEVTGILRQFDLGAGRITPLTLLRRDRRTPIEGDWSCWHLGNSKEAFLPARSEQIRPAPGRRWRTLKASDHDLKCSTAAMTGADAWVDPMLRGVIFLSGRLGQALIQADLANEKAGFGKLLKVDIVEG